MKKILYGHNIEYSDDRDSYVIINNIRYTVPGNIIGVCESSDYPGYMYIDIDTKDGSTRMYYIKNPIQNTMSWEWFYRPIQIEPKKDMPPPKWFARKLITIGRSV